MSISIFSDWSKDCIDTKTETKQSWVQKFETHTRAFLSHHILASASVFWFLQYIFAIDRLQTQHQNNSKANINLLIDCLDHQIAFISKVVLLFPYQAIIVCPPLSYFCLPSLLSSYLFLWSLISYFVVAKSSHGICYEPNFWLTSFFLTFTGTPTTLKYFFHQLYQNS